MPRLPLHPWYQGLATPQMRRGIAQMPQVQMQLTRGRCDRCHDATGTHEPNTRTIATNVDVTAQSVTTQHGGRPASLRSASEATSFLQQARFHSHSHSHSDVTCTAQHRNERDHAHTNTHTLNLGYSHTQGTHLPKIQTTDAGN